MLISRIVGLVCVGMVVLATGAVTGQDYPNKPIRIYTSDVGGGLDFLVRIVTPEISSSLGQPVIIENRGGSGIIPAQTVAKAPPDGYNLLSYGSPVWLLPYMQDNVPYDPLKDFSPITMMVRAPNLLAVHPSMPVKSVKELIALAKAKPGQLNFAVSVVGASSHLSGELFNVMAGVHLVSIPYKSASQALNALIGGHVQVMFPNGGSGGPHVKSGKLRALAVTSAQPSELFPGLPTVAAAGLPGFEATTLYGTLAPAKTPTAIINRLHQVFVRALHMPEVKAKLFNAGTEVVGSTPEQFAAAIKFEMTTWGKMIKDLGIRTQ